MNPYDNVLNMDFTMKRDSYNIYNDQHRGKKINSA